MTPAPIIDQATIQAGGPDPLGVLASCAEVVNHSQSVTIDTAAVDRLARDLVANREPLPAWDAAIHFQGTGELAIEQTIGWIFALDALNFCFWGQGPDPSWRWRIVANGQERDGYLALAIALRDAARAGTPVWNANWLAEVDEETVARIFAPAPGSAPIPLLPERAANLRELGQGLLALDADDHPFMAFVEQSGWSAPRLAQAVAATFPSFNDVVAWSSPDEPERAIEVRFLKRAQILASDLAGALDALPGSPHVTGRDQLTAFADYKVPQVLRHLGILAYEQELADRIRRREFLEAGCREEVEIRAATIWGCELLRQALAQEGGAFIAADVDWLLWNAGQALPPDPEPYHRAVTIFY